METVETVMVGWERQREMNGWLSRDGEAHRYRLVERRRREWRDRRSDEEDFRVKRQRREIVTERNRMERRW